MVAIFSLEERLNLENLAVISENEDENERILADGSVLTESEDDYLFTRKYPNGNIAEYRSDYNGEDELFLTKEETSDGRLAIYDYKTEYNESTDEYAFDRITIYERDEKGNYKYYKYEKNNDEIGDLTDTIKGNINDVHEPEERFNLDDLEVISKNGYEKLLADGSILTESEDDDLFTRKYPNGSIAEYRSDYNGEDELFLTKEETPDGKLVIYDYKQEYDEEKDETVYKQVKIYEKDASGNYAYYVYERDDDNEIGDFLKTVKGHINDVHEPEGRFNLEDLEVISESGYEKLLADGSILTESRDDYLFTRKYPNGDIAEYRNDYNDDNEDELFLTKTETTDGRLTVYGYKEEYDEDKDETIYTQVKVYEKDPNGHYISNEYKEGYNKEVERLLVTTEGSGDKWTKKTFYDENENPLYYQKDGDETRKYYLSGKLMEETNEDGVIFSYYESGVCKSEKHPNGAIKEYAPNKMLLFEKDEDGNYQRFQLNRDATGTLLLEKGDEYDFSERYKYDNNDYLLQKEFNTPKGLLTQIYYPGPEQQIKEEQKPDGTFTKWSKTNKKTYEKLPDGSYKNFSNGKDYQKFDKEDKLIEEANSYERVVYSYYEGTSIKRSIRKYDNDNNERIGAYRHFDKQGNENTAYYLARKKIIEKRVQQEDERAKRKGIDRVKAIKKRRLIKIAKYLEHRKALREISGK